MATVLGDVNVHDRNRACRSSSRDAFEVRAEKELMGVDQHHRQSHGEQKGVHHPVLPAALAKLAKYQQFGGDTGQRPDDHGRHDGDQRPQKARIDSGWVLTYSLMGVKT
jgi:hypothetical protein